MEDLKGLTSFVSELKARRTSLVDELSNIEATLSHLARLDGRSHHTERASAGKPDTKTKRIVSAAARRKMALAQKARWANVRKESQPMAVAKTTSPAPAKRKISAAGRKRIAAATRARWAAFRAAKKKAA